MDLSHWNADEWVRALTFVPLVICSIIGCALTLAKWWGTRQGGAQADQQRDMFLAHVRAGNYARAQAMATRDAPVSVQLAATTLERLSAGRAQRTARAERLGRSVVRRLEHGLGGLALIATLGPLFGLLGTVVGIIIIFGRLTATEGFASPQQLAGGIGTALYTTVGGLVIGVLALISHQLIAARIDRVTAEIEATTGEVIDIVTEDEP